MEYELRCKESAYPCEVTIDEDNWRFTVRKADTSGEYFNSPEELISWVESNWSTKDFHDEEQFLKMLQEIKSYYAR
ncbi:hypothetical protein ACWE42_07875 [Sutcliffiella cohnii]|uniref:Threonine dehydratase n=1 Tax=Sutcliffiella cohnii TaxID=33932 RepID=A0A223KT63_9BACI|nr:MULTISPECIES: hypothetical protein [Sutcliffiella]AST92685.1 hypothetical protein BC6307_15995 [Sutcliffiella cohnii]MED4016417.1 hypothetical protein [Sutcliffiella cohnii]WBL13932.1 hypothetical protein O1A01_18740 [Sutcliffiella sp. NC1]